jgi:hypothetical protein
MDRTRAIFEWVFALPFLPSGMQPAVGGYSLLFMAAPNDGVDGEVPFLFLRVTESWVWDRYLATAGRRWCRKLMGSIGGH